MTDKPHRIDVHHHIVPPAYLEMAGGMLGSVMPGGRIPDWNVEQSLEIMDRYGVATSLTSVSAPGVWLGEAEASRKLARECNEFAARMAADHPGRFGSFASLPLPDIDSSLAEIEYAFDVLYADGVVLMSNYEDRYLGDGIFTPIFEELNGRKAVAFIHPTVSSRCTGIQPEIPFLPPAVLEFRFDTTRAVTSLLYSGILARYSDIRFLIAHSGGALPFLVHHIAALSLANPEAAKAVPEGALYYLRRLFYETAGSANSNALASLTRLVSSSQILFGSESPAAAGRTLAGTIEGLSTYGFAAGDLIAIERGNAERLFPHFAT